MIKYIIKSLLFFIAVSAIFLMRCSKSENGSLLIQFQDPEFTGITFNNKINPFDSINIIQYLYAFNGSGVAIGDINNDGLPDIYFGANRGENKLFLNLGDLKFRDITTTAGVGGTGDWTTGVSMVDINADGLLDIYVCQVGAYKSFNGRNLLYINNGSGGFIEKAVEYGLGHRGLSTQAAFLDYDMDGDLDMYLLCHSVHSPGNYSDTTLRHTFDPVSGDRFFRNQGDRFEDITAETGIYSSKIGYGLGVGVSDFNNDGYPDLYIGNDFHENDYLYINQQDGTFKEEIEQAVSCNSKFSMGFDISDINNDGNADLFSLDMKPDDEIVLKTSEGPESSDIYELKLKYGYFHQYPRNMLQIFQSQDENTGTPRYSEIAQFSGLDATDWSWSALFADYDCDGYNDVYITNGILFRPNDMDYLNFISNEAVQKNEPDSVLIKKMPDGKNHNFIFRNNGDMTFDDKTGVWIDAIDSYSNGAAYADLDEDGDLDIVVNNINAPAFLLKNLTTENTEAHYLKLRLKGKKANPFAIGSKIKAYCGDQVYYRELNPVRGFMSSMDYAVHFGIGHFEKIDSIIIVWPDGKKQTEYSIPANQSKYISYSPNEVPDHVEKITSSEYWFRNITDKIKFDFRHIEDPYNDENLERLIPYQLSKEGPALATGDVNGDGLDDIYIGGAFGQSGAIFLQDQIGNFVQNQIEFWRGITKFEDVDAAFFDIDKDGDLDLYVASGGNHMPWRSPYYADRIYTNDGTGKFRDRTSFFESQTINSSCVAVGDLNGDDYLDVFVGARSVPGKYGIKPLSKIWINDGRGNLSQTDKIGLIEGMVTDAVITDLNKDGDNDLIVVGHWMPVTIYWNISSGLEKQELNETSGMWYSIAIDDLDRDGFPDIIAGNLGMNTYLKASIQYPLKMYTNDFNRDGSLESVISHYRNGSEYPIYHKDQLLKQMIGIKKKFIDYNNFANNTMEGIFDKEILDGSQKLEINELRSMVFYGGDQDFVRIPLPSEAQLSPVRAIEITDLNSDGKPDILALGNSHDFIPMIGRMSSNPGFLGLNKGNRTFVSLSSNKSGLFITDVCTHVRRIAGTGDSKRFVLAINNRPPQVYELKPEE